MKYLNTHLAAAKEYASQSKCERLKVGAIIINDNRPISAGYNGCVSGGSNICEINGITKKEVVHAEFNAIAHAAKKGIALENCGIIITHSPCFNCALLIKQSGITEIYYGEQYKDLEPVIFLRKHNVIIEEIK